MSFVVVDRVVVELTGRYSPLSLTAIVWLVSIGLVGVYALTTQLKLVGFDLALLCTQCQRWLVFFVVRTCK